jgi:YD repeat-containing protein
MSVPTASGLPMSVQLVHNSFNASIDIGVGKGWMTNLHSCVEEDGQTGDITYMDATGAKYLFAYDSQTQTYTNPKGFAGKMTKEVDGSFTLQSLGHTKLTFGSNGKITSIGETCGTSPDSVSIAYDGNGNPTAITDSLSNRSISLDYNGNGKLYQISDPLSNTWELSYNGSNQLIGLTQPEDTLQNPPPTPPSCSFSYDGNNLITGHDDFLGNEYTIGYEGSSPFKVTSWTDPASNQTTFAYTSASSPYDKKTTVTDAESIAIEYYFGATSGQVEKIQQSNGTDTLKIEMGYNGTTGFQTSSKDSYGNTTTISYDSVGHVTQITPPAGAAGQYTKTFTYSTPVSIDSVLEETEETVTNQADATTIFSYTDNNNPCLPTSITNPLGQTTSQTYNSHGQITSLTQPTTGGTKTTSFSYHATTHDLSVQTDALGNETQYLRNLNGMVNEVKMYEGTVGSGVLKSNIQKLYSQLNAIKSITDTITSLTSTKTKNANGATTSSTSELGCTTSTSFTDAASNAMPSKMDFTAPNRSIGSILPPVIPAPTFPFNPFQPLPAAWSNSKQQTTSVQYYDNGLVNTTTDHLGLTSQYQYDDFGRIHTFTDPWGKDKTYSLNLNNRPTSVQYESQGAIVSTFDNRNQVIQYDHPSLGSLSIAHDLRGLSLNDMWSTYSRDILGRITQISYNGGGSDTITYTPDGHVSSYGSLQKSYDSIGNITSWSLPQNGSASFSYNAQGSAVLGLVNTMTGTSHVGSQSYQYDSKNWLANFTDTSKISNPTFGYTYSNAKELTYLDYPANLQLQQNWSSKNITSQIYKNTITQTTYANIQQSFSSDQLSTYQYSLKAGMTNYSDTISLSHHTTGSMKGKLDTLSYNGSGRVITHGYDAVGRINSLLYSDIDPNNPFTLSYDNSARLSTISDPNSQPVITYQYDPSRHGRLTSISYSNGNSATFGWNAKQKITQYTYTDTSTQPPTIYYYEIVYNDAGKPSSHLHRLNGEYQYEWRYYYSPFGLDKLEKWVEGQREILIDTTVSKSGKVLSLFYQEDNCQTGMCYTGEASALYDPCGDLTSLVDQATSTEVYTRAIDKHSGAVIGIYNPFDMEIPITAIKEISLTYDHFIGGNPPDMRIPEERQWAMKEMIDNMTYANVDINCAGVAQFTLPEEECPQGSGDCGDDDQECIDHPEDEGCCARKYNLGSHTNHESDIWSGCAEAQDDFLFYRCRYRVMLNNGASEEDISQAASQSRYAACVAFHANCHWTTEFYDLHDMVSIQMDNWANESTKANTPIKGGILRPEDNGSYKESLLFDAGFTKDKDGFFWGPSSCYGSVY